MIKRIDPIDQIMQRLIMGKSQHLLRNFAGYRQRIYEI